MDNFKHLFYPFNWTNQHNFLKESCPPLKISLAITHTVQQDFFYDFLTDGLLPSLLLVLKDFPKLTSNLRRYSRFLIDSLFLFFAECRHSPYCLIRRVATLRIIIAGSHYLLELSASSLIFHLLQKGDTFCIIKYGESLLHALFIMGSHCWQRGIINKKYEGLPLPLKCQ
jgi:hypothetical protein